MRADWTHWAARAVATAWAGWWVFFGIASGIGERPFSWMNLLMHVIPVCVGAVPAVVAWRWPVAGGLLLLLEGLILAAFMVTGALRPHPFTVAFLALPPIVAGLLFLLSGPRPHPVQPG